MRSNKRLLHYMDLPIQHINDDLLRRMNRHGGAELIKENIKKLKDAVDDIVVRTTVIVGFPGESDEQFDELCGYIKREKFERLGAFTYSAEEGTPAAEFDGQIDEQVKQDRYDIIMKEQFEVTDAYNKSRVGKSYDMLVEGYDPVSEAYYGRSYADAPDVDGKIYVRAAAGTCEIGNFVNVTVTDVLDYDLVAEINPNR